MLRQLGCLIPGLFCGGQSVRRSIICSCLHVASTGMHVRVVQHGKTAVQRGACQLCKGFCSRAPPTVKDP